MTNQPRMLSDAEEARIQAGITAGSDNPERKANEFRRAKPFVKAFPALANSQHVSGPKKQPAKIAVSLRLTREVVERFKSKGPDDRRAWTRPLRRQWVYSLEVSTRRIYANEEGRLCKRNAVEHQANEGSKVFQQQGGGAIRRDRRSHPLRSIGNGTGTVRVQAQNRAGQYATVQGPA
jgi:uncharacterized protein (DUF4415 family)